MRARRRRLPRVVLPAAGFALVALLLAGAWWAFLAPVEEADGSVQVVRVLDGDTILVRRDDVEVTVRLLNVDTPETVAPGRPVECGGPAASAWLTERLPEGTRVHLVHDVERTDRYGRELARVRTDDGAVVNEQIVAHGLGRAIAVGANRTYYPQVRALQQQAHASGSGLFAPRTGCPDAAARDGRGAGSRSGEGGRE